MLDGMPEKEVIMAWGEVIISLSLDLNSQKI